MNAKEMKKCIQAKIIRQIRVEVTSTLRVSQMSAIILIYEHEAKLKH